MAMIWMPETAKEAWVDSLKQAEQFAFWGPPPGYVPPPKRYWAYIKNKHTGEQVHTMHDIARDEYLIMDGYTPTEKAYSKDDYEFVRYLRLMDM